MFNVSAKSVNGDEHMVVKLGLNKSPAKIKKAGEDKKKSNKNLDQHMVDNPPMKESGATMITDQVFIGDEDLSIDYSFLNNNKVTHILNAQADKILNVYDPDLKKNPEVIQKLFEHKQAKSPLIGMIKYFNITTWTEHKVPEVENLQFVKNFYVFIEDAVKNHESCLIIS